jgi:hypothetical protein
MHFASKRRHPEVVRLLLEKGADVKAKANVSYVRAVHVGYVAFLPTTNLPYPCLTASSVSDCRMEQRR